VCFLPHQRGCGRIEARHYCASIVETAKDFDSLGRLAPRERGGLSFNDLVIACDKSDVRARRRQRRGTPHFWPSLTVNEFVLPGLCRESTPYSPQPQRRGGGTKPGHEKSWGDTEKAGRLDPSHSEAGVWYDDRVGSNTRSEVPMFYPS